LRADRALAALIVGLIISLDVHAQGTPDQFSSALTVLHRQALSIMGEVLSRIVPAPAGMVSVSVEQASFPLAVENAALQVLQENHVAVVPGADSAAVLRLLVLDQSVRYDQLVGGLFERTILTRLEARWEDRAGGGWRYLGEFERSEKDTARNAERPVVTGSAAHDTSQVSSGWERIVTPVVVLGGAVLIIYLFFTVRS
jgi:hypothetical protein